MIVWRSLEKANFGKQQSTQSNFLRSSFVLLSISFRSLIVGFSAKSILSWISSATSSLRFSRLSFLIVSTANVSSSLGSAIPSLTASIFLRRSFRTLTSISSLTGSTIWTSHLFLLRTSMTLSSSSSGTSTTLL
ncbi:poly(A) polymerase, putative [Ferroglobus placidus DSM 10642]|uniref:Poly(A) polymerase, putative n=1 Tax=Ferroglobus placidus (strain DSM 10642 / AEDII12DO) TaxID=589924 RepID=D3RXL5_FERPA|nr:poly(A) polymerase, putative [Ferroglobus placidus DSM 10642]